MEFIKTLDIETIVLAFGSMMFVILLFRWHFDTDNKINITSLFMQDDKLSLFKFGQAIALIVSTWVLIYQTRKGGLTDWLFTGYMLAWSGANIASKFIDSRNNTSGNIPTSYRQTSYRYDEEEPQERGEPLDYRSTRDRV